MPIWLVIFFGLASLLGCDNQPPANAGAAQDSTASPRPAALMPAEQIQAKLDEIAALERNIAAKQNDFTKAGLEFRNRILKAREELLAETDADRINNRIANLREYDAYAQEIDRRLQILGPVPDRLQTIRNSLQAKLAMVRLNSEVDLSELRAQLSRTIEEYTPEMGQLVIDTSRIRLKSDEEILSEINAERQRKQDEALQREQEEQRNLQAQQSERLRRQKEEQRRVEAQRLKEVQDAKKRNDQIGEEICDGIVTRISELTEISLGASQCIKQYYRGERLLLSEVAALNGKVAANLVDWCVDAEQCYFYLQGLTELTPEVAGQLANFITKATLQTCMTGRCYVAKTIFIYLDGIKSLDPSSIKILNVPELATKGASVAISLNGVGEISPRVAEYLSQLHPGYTYSLNKITRLSREAAKKLCTNKPVVGSLINLAGLLEMPDEIKVYLNSCNIVLSWRSDGVRSVDRLF